MHNRRQFIGGAALLASGVLIGKGIEVAITGASAPRRGPPWFIVGDSIAEGLIWASGEPGQFRRGLPIDSAAPLIIHQNEAAPAGSHLVIALGTYAAASGK